ncbi:glycosyltransferase family 4 protein [Rhodoplanes sp. Z2-YC6860]|uniref:glycosyltransferase family 4 protein n=1 Tax=Rhodoplanes sp. Z2-YC6860 TaxID=674703 RepID=UPI00078E9E93|nr:glycosyltransferase family 4 protein [Rhodoplanes sp. Z2-YC6860]AMN39075.1 glycosyl transferase family protein [Rhodoplanes sp. Z2-YC6860]
MTPLQRVAFIGNHLPRRCGIATFTHDLHRAVSLYRLDLETGVVVMTDAGRIYDYPVAVQFQINDEVIGEYIQAADFLNDARFDVVCLQHEYGIFGGEAGRNIVELLSRLEMPVVTTLHTILAKPTSVQHEVMSQIIDASSKLIVMAEKGRELLRSVHSVPARKIEIIPHGIPDFPFLEPHHAKAKLGLAGKTILTFGLLSPSKGIETVIDAMPTIIKSCPSALYVVLGATHPNLLRNEGETYRDRLMARVRELGVEEHVTFCNQFVDQATLLDYISMCDVYVTPYLNEFQMTSGTLAYSFGLGKTVVSTPYWHAKELLADGRGILVPFSDSAAIGREISGLLTNNVRSLAMRKRAYASSRSMTWAQVAKRYVAVFADAHERALHEAVLPLSSVDVPTKVAVVPEVKIDHFLSLCDNTGILQHAVYSVADRSHGYCVDDNARALLLSCALAYSGDAQLLSEINTARFAAFVQHAWNPASRRFRNFMSYDRRWLEEAGSEDSHGRTLWALAECARADSDPSRRVWAAALFKTALPAVEEFSSPRAWAFSLLGLNAYCALAAGDLFANGMRKLLADRLMALFVANQHDDWLWFENVLAYDNARLPHALIQTGLATNTAPYVATGLRSLGWLMSFQTASSGSFRPVGSKSFGKIRQKPDAFDQQPVEAAATIAACLAAERVNGDEEWSQAAMRAFAWFLGENDLHMALIDPSTGSCSDGLHPDRSNENKGAESVLSYLLALVEIRQFVATSSVVRTKPASKLSSNGNGAGLPRLPPGSIFVPIQIPEPAEPLPASGPGQGRRQALQTGD